MLCDCYRSTLTLNCSLACHSPSARLHLLLTSPAPTSHLLCTYFSHPLHLLLTSPAPTSHFSCTYFSLPLHLLLTSFQCCPQPTSHCHPSFLSRSLHLLLAAASPTPPPLTHCSPACPSLRCRTKSSLQLRIGLLLASSCCRTMRETQQSQLARR